MRLEQAEILDRDGNYAVVQLPGRKFPGILAQGDTMASIRDLLRDASEENLQGVDEYVADQILEARDRLIELMEYYGSVLDAHGIKRPYF